jgi:hypothetical protein
MEPVIPPALHRGKSDYQPAKRSKPLMPNALRRVGWLPINYFPLRALYEK